MKNEHEIIGNDKVYSILGKIAQKYNSKKKTMKNELSVLKDEVDTLETLSFEIRAIEDSVKLGVLKSFKIKRVMIPSEYKDRDEMEAALLSKKEKLSKLTKEYDNLLLSTLSWGGYLNKNFVRGLFDPSYSSKHFGRSVVFDDDSYVHEVSLIAKSPLGLIYIGDWNENKIKRTCIRSMDLTGMKDYSSALDSIKRRLESLLDDDEVDESIKLNLQVIQPSLDSLTFDEIKEFVAEIYSHCGIVIKGAPFYEEILNEIDIKAGIDFRAESPIERASRRNKDNHYPYKQKMLEFVELLASKQEMDKEK